jgi:hypothetical protein
MPLIQGGPPEWIWERMPEALKWEVVARRLPSQAGLIVMRLAGEATLAHLLFQNQYE